jgi:spermidine/putrescine transport system permease protein
VSTMRPAAGVVIKTITVLGFLVLYVPLFALVTYSFLPLPTAHGWMEGFGQVWTLEWYRKLWGNQVVLDALKMSVYVGLWSTAGATFLGTGAALALVRTRFPGRKIFDTLTYVPLIMPEIVLGLSLLIWFVLIQMTLGAFSIILAHITFTLSYVIITVKARLQGFDSSLEEAARDLGANAWSTFWRVTFPLISPGILSGALMAFTLSFDDFLVAFFTAGVGSDTLPLKIYSMIKFGVTPEINALSTILLAMTLGLVVLVFNPWKISGSKQQRF